MEHYQQRSHFLLSNHLHTHLFTMLYCSFTPPTMLDTIFGLVTDRNYTANILIRFAIVIHYVRTLEHYEQKGTNLRQSVLTSFHTFNYLGPRACTRSPAGLLQIVNLFYKRLATNYLQAELQTVSG